MSPNSFVFPPPPPPPPNFTSSTGHPQQSSARGPRGHGHDGRERLIRGGFGNARGQFSNSRDSYTWHEGVGHSGNSEYPSQGPRGQKRPHEQAFQPRGGNQGRGSFPQSTAPLPVPSFGFAMPPRGPSTNPVERATRVQPPSNDSHSTAAAKRNLLGLTLASDDIDGAGEMDEEAKFAAQDVSGTGLQFTYRGQTASLNSKEDIAAWIAERKKKFPTRKRAIAAKEKVRVEAEERAKKMAELGSRGPERGRGREWGRGRGRGRGQVPVPRTLPLSIQKQSETAKLQQQLAEARGRVAELEKQAKSMRPGDSNDVEIEKLLRSSSDSDVHVYSDDELTSSSGRELDDAEDAADESDSDGPPVQETSKSNGPKKVILPPRRPPQVRQVCRDFAQHGRCSRGRRCQFDHGPTEKKARGRHGTVNGKSLYTKLKDQQEEISDELVLQYVLFLGDSGYLAEPDTTSQE